MKTATALTLVAIGAILAFAVRWEPRLLNLDVAGWVLMVVGSIGLVVPRRRYGWLRKRTVRRGSPGKQQVDIEEVTVEPAEPKYSPLIAPGGIDTSLDGSLSESTVDEPPVSSR
jgi:hypothetical protein